MTPRPSSNRTVDTEVSDHGRAGSSRPEQPVDRRSAYDWYRPALDPATIAIIGASSDPEKNHYQRQLQAYGYRGQVFPVNPRVDEIDGLATYATIGDVPVHVDLALIALPAAAVADAVAQCVAVGVSVVYVYASGFSEAGPEGARLEDTIRAALAAAEGRTRMIGPNGTGVLNVDSAMVGIPLASHTAPLPLVNDGLAIVSQSGLVGSVAYISSQLSRPAIGKVVAIGNEGDVGLADVFEAFVADDSVYVVLVYMEGLRDPTKFLNAAREARRKHKPIVVLKGGMTDIGAAAAASHTASLAGNAAVFAGVLAEYGVRQADSVTHMLDVARILRAHPRFDGRRVMILTGSGGSGIILTDHLRSHGFELGEWGTSERDRLGLILPAYVTIANPLDGAADFSRVRPALAEALLLADANEDTDIVVLTLGGMPDTESLMTAALVGINESAVLSKPLLVVWIGGTGRALQDLNAAGIPAFSDLDQLTRAMATAVGVAAEGVIHSPPEDAIKPAIDRLSAAIERAQSEGARALDESTSRSVLKAAGVHATCDIAVTDAVGAVSAAADLGHPVVLKLRAPGLLHKSELGAVAINVQDAGAVASEADRLLAIAESHGIQGADILVQRQVATGVEFLLGMVRDPVFGPVITFGLGGVLAEALDDVQTFTPDVTYDGFVHAFRALRHQSLLAGYRHLPPVEPSTLWPTVEAFCTLVRALPVSVHEIDVNPLVAGPDGVVAVDALIVLGAD